MGTNEVIPFILLYIFDFISANFTFDIIFKKVKIYNQHLLMEVEKTEVIFIISLYYRFCYKELEKCFTNPLYFHQMEKALMI